MIIASLGVCWCVFLFFFLLHSTFTLFVYFIYICVKFYMHSSSRFGNADTFVLSWFVTCNHVNIRVWTNEYMNMFLQGKKQQKICKQNETERKKCLRNKNDFFVHCFFCRYQQLTSTTTYLYAFGRVNTSINGKKGISLQWICRMLFDARAFLTGILGNDTCWKFQAHTEYILNLLDSGWMHCVWVYVCVEWGIDTYQCDYTLRCHIIYRNGLLLCVSYSSIACIIAALWMISLRCLVLGSFSFPVWFIHFRFREMILFF